MLRRVKVTEYVLFLDDELCNPGGVKHSQDAGEIWLIIQVAKH